MTQIINRTIYADENWSESFWLVRPTLPIDLTGVRLEMWIRPLFDHAVLIRKLSSALGEGGEIIIDDALKGAVSIHVGQGVVAANITIGVWNYFLRGVSGANDIEEYQRGRLTVHPGRT